jgi:hypothetical protein
MLGPDQRRLWAEGDFNVEIDFSDLAPGANTVEIIHRTAGNQEIARKTVTVNYLTGNDWPQNYFVDWTAAPNVQAKAQVVDGLWTTDANGLRCATMGYDRVVAIGDAQWTDYEVTATITMNALDPAGFDWPSVSPGFGITLRWPGHTDNPVVCSPAPTCGWLPSGGTLWYNAGFYNFPAAPPIRLTSEEMDVPYDRELDYGKPYVFKLRVQGLPGGGSQYFAKIWDAALAEPAGWDLVGSEGPSDEPDGSAIIIAHHMDISVADVSIAPVVQGPGTTVSDDFSDAGFTNANWSFVNPDGDASGFAVVGGELQITVDDANTNGHDAWVDGNNLPRLRQSLANTNAVIEVKFNSGLGDGGQVAQGILLEQTDRTFVRFELLRIGGNDRVFAAAIEEDAPGATELIDFPGLPDGLDGPLWLRVTRTDDTFAFEYSTDGATFNSVGSFDFALAASAVSIYAGNEPGVPFTSLVDYFQIASDPIADEDGTLFDLTVTTVGNGSVTVSPEQHAYADGTPVTLTATPGGSAQFDGWSGDVSPTSVNPLDFNVTSDVNVVATFSSLSVPLGLASDNFDCPGTLLHDGWEFINPLGDNSTAAVLGGVLAIDVDLANDHSAFVTTNNVPAVMQDVADVDFVIEAKFDSPLVATTGTEQQTQGVLIEESPNRFVRVDFSTFGPQKFIYAAMINVGASPQQLGLEQLPGLAPPMYVRITRTGNLFDFDYSLDGAIWEDYGQIAPNGGFVVNSMGVYGGNNAGTPHMSRWTTSSMSRPAG